MDNEIIDAEVVGFNEPENGTAADFKKPKHEFSKVIAVIAIVMWIFVNLFSMAMIAITLDTSGLMYIVGSVDAVVAIVYTTYSLKAKAENMIKLKKLYGYDAESVVDAVLRHENQDYDTD